MVDTWQRKEMNASFVRDVVTTAGATQNPIHLNPVILVIHLACCFIGIPLNGFVACTITYQRRLRRKPRNIFLLGLILSNLYAFLPPFIELVYFHFPSMTLCRAYVAVVGLPYVTFLINIFLALIDRYTALSYPLWHRRKLTVRYVIVCQIVCTLVISIIYKFPYVTQILPLECEVKFLQVKLISMSLLVLLTICVIAQVVVYKKTRDIVRQASLSVNCPERNKNCPTSFRQARAIAQTAINTSASEDQVEVAAQQMARNSSSATANDRSIDMSVHVGNNRLGRLEVEASRTLTAGVLSLFIMTGPFIAFTITMLTCRVCGLNCQHIGWLAPYFKELVVIHAIYNPIMYLIRSKEFFAALRGPIRY